MHISSQDLFSSQILCLGSNTGNGGCGQLIPHSLCCSFLPKGRTPFTPFLLQSGALPRGTSPHKLLTPESCPHFTTAPACIPSCYQNLDLETQHSMAFGEGTDLCSPGYRRRLCSMLRVQNLC